MDCQVPAKMGVAVGSVPASIVVGAAADVDVTVTNTADVVVALGADELDYVLSTSGDLSGSASDTDQALGGGNTHQVTLGAASAGAKTGQIDVTSSSQEVADGNFAQPASWDVFDHSEASFDPNGDLDELTIDFGTIRQGRTADPETFDVRNLEATPNYTADLEIDSVGGTGDTSVLTTDLGAFSGIAAGTGHTFAASLSTTSNGAFAATYTAQVSDVDMPGATAGTPLTLNLAATVSLLGDVDVDGDLTVEDIDANDIDTLYSRFGTSDMFADLNDSGVVDQADVDMLIQVVLGTEYGDINLDGEVNDADYTIYAAHYGQAGGWADGDVNGDGVVTGADYTIWAANYGFGDSE
jgi:hypothetical protein